MHCNQKVAREQDQIREFRSGRKIFALCSLDSIPSYWQGIKQVLINQGNKENKKSELSITPQDQKPHKAMSFFLLVQKESWLSSGRQKNRMELINIS